MKIKKIYQVETYERCKRCNRILKSADSKIVGYGKSCYKKMMIENMFNGKGVRKLWEENDLK
jgi:hypothetical protein|nr:MAG TPA: hypothetical protein [Caudoviricetes sp.]